MGNNRTRRKSAPNEQPQVLPGFRPFREMWSGEQPLYPSEQAARWGIRVLRTRLVDAKAMAVLGRDLYYHPARVADVISAAALEAFERRARPSGAGGER